MNDNSRTTISKWLDSSRLSLKQSGITSYSLDALLLIEHATGTSRAHLLAHENDMLSQNELKHLELLLRRRLLREPMAYIIGFKEFYGRNFSVNKHVLIPRPESETFITLLSDVILDNNLYLLDVGCGSGAIGITVAKEFPLATVDLADISAEALQVARNNADLHNVQLKFIKQDLVPPGSYDIVTANLPYVPLKMPVQPELAFEPSLALFGGDDGMNLYKRFWSLVPKTGATFVLTESLETQHPQQAELARSSGYICSQTDGLVQLFKRA